MSGAFFIIFWIFESGSERISSAWETAFTAVSRSVKNGDNWEDRTSFIKVKGFGKGYENACKHLTKGSSAIVEGYLEQECWEKDGQKRSEIVVIADRIYPTYKKSGDNNGGNGAPKTEPKQTQNNDGFQEDFPF